MDLQGYLRILKGGWRLLLILFVTGLVVAVGFHESQAPVYKATTVILLQPNDPVQQLAISNGAAAVDPVRYARDQLSVITSDPVIKVAASNVPVGLTGSQLLRMVSITNSSASEDVLSIVATSSGAAEAAQVANALANAYISSQQQSVVTGLKNAVTELQGRLDTLSATISQLRSGISSNISLASAQQQYQTLYTEQQQLNSDIALVTGNAEILSAARAPTIPAGLSLARTGLLGGILGALIGSAILVLRDAMDRRLRTGDDLLVLAGESATIDLSGASLRSTGARSRSLQEGLRRLRATVQAQSGSDGRSLVLVSSPTHVVDRQLVAEDLARAFVGSGQSTVLICADPSNARNYSLPPNTSTSSFRTLSDLVSIVRDQPRTEGRQLLEDALAKSQISGLWVVPFDPTISTDYLASPAVSYVLGTLADSFSVVIVDVAPCLVSSDALALCPVATGMVLVGTSLDTTRDEMAEAFEAVKASGVPLLAAVLAAPTPRSADGWHRFVPSGPHRSVLPVGARAD